MSFVQYMCTFFLILKRINQHVSQHLVDMIPHVFWQDQINRIWGHVNKTFPKFFQLVGMLAADISFGGGSSDMTWHQHVHLRSYIRWKMISLSRTNCIVSMKSSHRWQIASTRWFVQWDASMSCYLIFPCINIMSNVWITSSYFYRFAV